MEISNYDKTEKGREEIATRKYQLPTRLRSLLVLVDGRQTDEDLVQKMGALGLNELSLQKLQTEGYISKLVVDVGASDHAYSLDAEVKQEIQEQKNNEIAMIDSTIGQMGDLEESQTIFEASETDDGWNANLDAILAAEDDDEDRESRVDMMKRYLADLIKENLGIKGFFLQRRLLKAKSLEDIHAFRQDYVSAILYAKGKDRAIELRDQFDQRMYVRFSLTDPEFLEN